MSEPEFKSQNEAVKYHLEEIGPIDHMTALNLYGIARLASRIHELKKELEIETKMVKSVISRNKKAVKFARYSITKEES